jgi:hypothetical protein
MIGSSLRQVPARILVGGSPLMTVENHTNQQERSDLEEVYRLFAEGKRVTDPELIRRIRDRSEAARRAVFERNGLLDIAVPAIRALRDGDDT